MGLEKNEVFQTVGFCEFDQNAQIVLKKNYPNIPIFNDVRELNSEELKKKNISKIDVIAGGFPCQDISIAGKKLGIIEGKRSSLWGQFHRLIEELQPSYAIIENVANLRNMGLAKVLKDLHSIGYNAEWHVISASSLGASHRRERVWIIAYKDIKNVNEQMITSTIINNYRNSQIYWPVNWENKTPATLEYKKEEKKAREKRIKQLGNAIVPPTAHMIGKLIKEKSVTVVDNSNAKSYNIDSLEDLTKMTGRSGLLRNGLHYEINAVAPFNAELDCGLFPTPTCRDSTVIRARTPEKMIMKGHNILRKPGIAEMFLQPQDFPTLFQN